MKTLPNFYFEKEVWKKGFEIVGGCDEVGRGCLAGPVVCGVVVFQRRYTVKNLPENIRIDDSKKLTAKRRVFSAKWIKRNSLVYGIGIGKVSEINKFGIVGATQKAFRRAISNANKKLVVKNKKSIEFLLLDAFYVPYTRGLTIPRKSVRSKNKRSVNQIISGGQLAIINGDEKSISIAAASIIAKVFRDKFMEKLSKETCYKKYKWDKNKGYGTKKHIEALRKFGYTSIHRILFVNSLLH